MQYQALLLTILAATATASQLRMREAATKCGNGQVVSCCNSGSDSSDGSLLGGLGENILGGNCDMVPINVIGANGILDHACGGNQAACCTGDFNGLVNVACDPISL